MAYYATWKGLKTKKYWEQEVYRSILDIFRQEGVKIWKIEYLHSHVLDFNDKQRKILKTPLSSLPEHTCARFWTKIILNGKLFKGTMYFDPYNIIPEIPEFAWNIYHDYDSIFQLVQKETFFLELGKRLNKLLNPQPAYIVLGEHYGAIDLEYGTIDVIINKLDSFSKVFAKALSNNIQKQRKEQFKHLNIKQIIEVFLQNQFNGEVGISKLVDKASLAKPLITIASGSIQLISVKKEEGEWSSFLQVSAKIFANAIAQMIEPRDTFVKKLEKTIEQLPLE